jgi:hypothetical protein
MLLRRERTSLQCDDSSLAGHPDRRNLPCDLPIGVVRKSPQPSTDRRAPTVTQRSL